MAFHSFEHHSVDNVSNRDDQDHDSNDGAHVVQVASHHQHLAKAEAEVKHFSGYQGTPRKGPSLFQARDNKREAGWKQHIPEQLETLRAKISSGLAEDFGHLLA